MIERNVNKYDRFVMEQFLSYKIIIVFYYEGSVPFFFLFVYVHKQHGPCIITTIYRNFLRCYHYSFMDLCTKRSRDFLFILLVKVLQSHPYHHHLCYSNGCHKEFSIFHLIFLSFIIIITSFIHSIHSFLVRFSVYLCFLFMFVRYTQ